MKITITGDLYSGKSTLAKKLIDYYKLDLYSVGLLIRKNAEELGMTIVEYNKYMEENSLDNIIDEATKRIGIEKENFIFDARLSWNFIPDSIKIYLKVNIEEAAKRALEDKRGKEERYHSIEDAKDRIKERTKLERERFMELYNIDIYDLHNYDLILDSSNRDSEEVFYEVVKYIGYNTIKNV